TACRSKVERPMTLSMSAVAVCCCLSTGNPPPKIDEALFVLYAVIHPIGVSGEKHVCPATFFNQLHQCLTPRIARVHLDAGALRERGIDFVKRIFHRRSGENSNFPLLRKN